MAVRIWKMNPWGQTQRGGVELTRQQVGLAALIHQEAELQHQLRGAAQEGLQQPQHAHVRALEQHTPVEVAPQPLSAPPALQP